MTEKPEPMILKVVEIHACVEGDEGTDYLIADKEASEAAIMMGTQGVYCQVADRLTADMFITCVNAFTERGITDPEGFMRSAYEAKRSLDAVVTAIGKYLPPDGVSIEDAMSAIIQATDNPAINEARALLSQMEARD